MAKIGIDFGTTYTTVAHVGNDGKAEAIRIDGNEKIPTILYYSPDGGEPLIGEAAFNMFEICRSLEDQEEINRHMAGMFYSLKREMDPDQRLYLPDGRDLSYSEMIGEFFHYIKAQVEETCYSGEKITDVCITYPVEFEYWKKDILENAAKKAGFSNVSMLIEPVAASIGYDQTNDDKDSSVLIYDFGGGTFDVAFVKFDKSGDYITLPPMGNMNCGGEDIDRLLYDEWYKIAFKDIGDGDKQVDAPFLKTICKQQKEFLCRMFKKTSQWELKAKVAGKACKMQVTKVQWNSLISPVVDQTVTLTKKMLDVVKEKKYEIDKVILIGGSSNIPLVRENLEKILPIAPQPVQDSDIAVAKGAAIYVTKKKCYCRICGKQITTLDKFCPYCNKDNILFFRLVSN